MSFVSASLETIDGKPVEKSTLQGKIVALYFSSSWCKFYTCYCCLFDVLLLHPFFYFVLTPHIILSYL